MLCRSGREGSPLHGTVRWANPGGLSTYQFIMSKMGPPCPNQKMRCISATVPLGTSGVSLMQCSSPQRTLDCVLLRDCQALSWGYPRDLLATLVTFFSHFSVEAFFNHLWTSFFSILVSKALQFNICQEFLPSTFRTPLKIRKVCSHAGGNPPGPV